MSYDKSTYYDLSKGLKKWVFSWGYVDNVDDFDMSACYSPYARNFRLDGQSVKIRPWYQMVANNLADGDYPRGIGSYLQSTSSNDRIVIRHNITSTSKLYLLDLDSASLTNINTSTDIASDNKMRFYNIADVLYCMNGSDDMGKLSWTTYSLPAKPAWFKPAFATIFDGKMVASGQTSTPNKVFFSVADDYEDFQWWWADEWTFSEQVTWLASTWQALFYFTPNTISVTDRGDIVNSWWTISYNSTQLQATEGAKYHDCIVPVWMNLYFLSSSNIISRIARQSNNWWFEVVGMSNRKYAGIEKIMSTLDTDQSKARAMYYPQDELIKRHLVTKWSTIPDLCIIYDVDKDSFLVDTGKYFGGGTYFHNQYIVTSAITGTAFRDEYSQDDAGSPIWFEYRTKKFYLSWWEFKNTLWESRWLVAMNELAEPTQTIRIDWQQKDISTLSSSNIPLQSGWIGTDEIGAYEIGTDWEDSEEMYEIVRQRTKGNLNRPWRRVQRRRTNTTLAGKFVLKHVIPRLESKPPISVALQE